MTRLGRLGRGTALDLLLRRGKRTSHPLLFVVWQKSRESVSQFAFIVPRAVDKRAVVRNRLRRRMREFMRRYSGRLARPVDAAITCRPAAAAASKDVFYEALEELLGFFERNLG